MMNKNFCPICGFDKLQETVDNKNPSYEICPCCGFEFGFDDHINAKDYQTYRANWIKNGAQWFIKAQKPKNWDFAQQLSNIGVSL